MKKRNQTRIFSTAWILVNLLQWQFVSSYEVTFLSQSKGNISSRFYPYKYPQKYQHEWRIIAPMGHRIRLEFKDFDVGDCTHYGDILEVQSGRRFFKLCGQRLPNLIESKWNYMDLYIDSKHGSTGGRFWAYYETFKEVKFVTLKPTLFTDVHTNSIEMSSTQRLFILLSIFGCVLVLVVVTIYCGYRRRPRQTQSPMPANNISSTSPDNENRILELNFGDPPPSYDEVVGHTNPVESDFTSQTAPGVSTAGENGGIDSSGLPSYTAALRLSRQSLDANV